MRNVASVSSLFTQHAQIRSQLLQYLQFKCLLWVKIIPNSAPAFIKLVVPTQQYQKKQTTKTPPFRHLIQITIP